MRFGEPLLRVVCALERRRLDAVGERFGRRIPTNIQVHHHVPGSRAVTHGWGREQNLSVYTPVIVKYRDSKTESSVQLEELLR